MSCWMQFPSCLMIRFIFSPSLPFVCPCRNNCYTYWRGSPYSFVINYYSTHQGTKKCIVLSGFKYLWMFLKKEIWQSEADTLTHPTVCGSGLNYSLIVTNFSDSAFGLRNSSITVETSHSNRQPQYSISSNPTCIHWSYFSLGFKASTHTPCSKILSFFVEVEDLVTSPWQK